MGDYSFDVESPDRIPRICTLVMAPRRAVPARLARETIMRCLPLSRGDVSVIVCSGGGDIASSCQNDTNIPYLRMVDDGDS